MNHDDILALRELTDKDKAIFLTKEGIFALENELAPLLSELQEKNKSMYLDLLVHKLETLNDILAYSVKFLSNDFTKVTTLQQAILESNIIKNIEEI